MIVTDRHVYPSPIKTGTTSVRKVLMGRGGHSPVPKHYELWRFPTTSIGDRTVFSTVRNPWDWYYSLWWHGLNMAGPKENILLVYGRGKLDFPSVLYGMTHLESVSVPYYYGVVWVGKRQPSGTDGLCTWVLSTMLAEDGLVGSPWLPSHYIPTDRLWEGLGLVLDEDLSRAAPPAQNTAAHWGGQPRPPLVEAYDSSMVRWVRDADRALIERFGFSFNERAPHPLYIQPRS